MVFQEPMTSLNPVLTIGEQIAEVLHAASRVAHGAAARARAVELLGRVGIPDPQQRARRAIRTALRRHAPARDDRDGARLRAEAADRRRADDGARRHRAGADPGPAARPAGAARHGAAADHPRPRRRRRDRRPRRRDVCRPHRRDGAGRDAVRAAAASLHAGLLAASLRLRGRRPAAAAGDLRPCRRPRRRCPPAAPSRRAAPRADARCRVDDAAAAGRTAMPAAASPCHACRCSRSRDLAQAFPRRRCARVDGVSLRRSTPARRSAWSANRAAARPRSAARSCG